VVASFRGRQPGDALRWLADGAAAAAALGDTWGEGLALTLLGLAEARAGRPDPARAHLTTVLRSRLQGGVTATAMVGMALLHLPKDPRRALTVLEAAVALRERTGVPAFPVPVQRVFDDAHAQAARRVAAAVARTCRDRARALSTSEAIAMACAGPAMTEPLTARQQEVAALVAGGLSNRAVAERLHLSVRTVESHVARALDTLGLADRAQLAAWAHEAGLAP
jgi:DNA-binding NarL/FixJ family response regulator